MKKLLLILLVFSGVQLSAIAYEPIVTVTDQEKTIHPRDLPEKIRKYVTDNYNGAQITKAAIDESDETINEYTVLINFKQQKVSLKFDKKGDFIRKE